MEIPPSIGGADLKMTRPRDNLHRNVAISNVRAY